MSQKTRSEKSAQYSATLQLPKTRFSMRANLLQMEPLYQDRWNRLELYRRIRQSPRPQGPYTLHDGPPYANGPIHLGHLLNKILKDLVVRSRMMAGHDVDFVPGWDCHGLPIEHKVLKELGADARELETLEIRRRCHEYAQRYVRLQAQQMQRLGTIGDYDHPYLTMDPGYEAGVLEVFALLVSHGLVYRAVKPVHWSVANQTALAEAELEYYEREDTSVYVLFEIEDPQRLPTSLRVPAGERVYLMIWTTTPWTLPANLAVAVAPMAEYSLCGLERQGRPLHVIVAEDLVASVLEASGASLRERAGRCRGGDLIEAAITYRHPFLDRRGVVVGADYVTLEDGTGLVHTAPGHGAEDYYTGIREGLPIYCPVQADGTFDDTAPEWLQGLDVWKANQVIVERLSQSQHLFHAHSFVHSYPHDWRSKTPTIFRATEQWFIAVDQAFGQEGKSLRQRALEAARQSIQFVPDWGRSRLEGMLEARPDWCISRQRAWGLPIPAFRNSRGEVLLTEASVKAVARVIREQGSDCWFRASAQELLALYDPQGDEKAPDWLREGGRKALAELEKFEDIFDVWFESGSSWHSVLRQRGMPYPADLYLEGSDQHRGWFQLSLLPALGATGQAPFRALLTHGFMVDAQGRKMSKSLGNAVEVEDLLKQHGADVCRWWVSSLSYTHDVKVDWEFFKVAGEEYRKVRNTIRFLLGNLHGFDPASDRRPLEAEDRYTLDWWARAQLARLLRQVQEGYQAYDFKEVSEAIFHFCNDSMSAVYLAAVKDRLYCDAPDSPRRRRTQTVLFEIADSLIRALAPILVHTAEEAYLALYGRDFEGTDSVHLTLLPEPFSWEADPGWEQVMKLRQLVLKALEEAKTEQGLSNPLDAGVESVLPSSLFEVVVPFQAELADLCGVSRFRLEPGDSWQIAVRDLRREPRCERSWKRDGTVRRRSDGGMLSDRDAQVLGLA